ncbi:hypothetical protein [Streptomyces sp. enrichment culture]|uniref:hypothetical protein n=1 Tax=Streptomyces sp. enrichment culture TaxID=1795815 RepID=UPI003F554C47
MTGGDMTGEETRPRGPGPWARLWTACGVLLALLALCAACTPPDGGGQRAGSPRGQGSRGSPVGPTDAGALPRIPSATGLPGWSHATGFAADGSGFTLLADCGGTGCRQGVAVLDAGAGGWRTAESPLPVLPPDAGVTAGLTVLGPGRALITEGTARPGRAGPTAPGSPATRAAPGSAARHGRRAARPPSPWAHRSCPSAWSRTRTATAAPATGSWPSCRTPASTACCAAVHR